MAHVAIEHDESIPLVRKLIVGLVLEAKGTIDTGGLTQVHPHPCRERNNHDSPRPYNWEP